MTRFNAKSRAPAARILHFLKQGFVDLSTRLEQVQETFC